MKIYFDLTFLYMCQCEKILNHGNKCGIYLYYCLLVCRFICVCVCVSTFNRSAFYYIDFPI
jgi:hypothetical protein